MRSITAEIEASYEEELPEEEYREPEEKQKRLLCLIADIKNSRRYGIDVAHKPPYFGARAGYCRCY